jgi:hypothetical protein
VTAVAQPTVVVTEPGIHPMTAETYHADPVPEGSLSSSGVKKLLPPSCPAIFKWERDHGQPHKKEFDFGHAAHQKVLGAGPDIAVVKADSWRTDYAKAAKAEAYEAGKVPLLEKDHQVVVDMAAAIRAHPLASRLFAEGTGMAEVPMFWRDAETGIWRRVMADWLRNRGPGRPTVVDYKSLVKVDNASLSKTLVDYGYAGQAPWYLDGAQALGEVDDDAAFLFVAQMKTPPYLINTWQPNPAAIAYGRSINRQAIDIFARCQETGVWPDFSGGEIQEIALPPWVERAHPDLF